MKKKLILVNNEKNEYFPEDIPYCYLRFLYVSNSFINRIARKIFLKLKIDPAISFIFQTWIKDVNNVDTIILFDTGNAPYISSFLRRKFPEKRIIIWYWNPVSGSIPYANFDSKGLEFWSFDPTDCEKYGFKYNTQFFISKNSNKVFSSLNQQDVFYVGADKNRSKILADLKRIFDKNNISYYFNLVRFHNSTNEFGIEYMKPLSYAAVIENIKNSKVIVDLVADEQTGLTLRPLEALFYKKKLITNMKTIKQYDFYNQHNIFIIGMDNDDTLKQFIESDYDESNHEELTFKYEFRSWVNRFDDV